MSDQPIDPPAQRRPWTIVLTLCLNVLCSAIFFASGFKAAIVHAEEIHGPGQRSLPVLVRALPGDTPASLAGRYLNDPAKSWMITEYNGLVSISEGQAILVPTGPFRLGGMTPDGYQTVPVLAYSDIGESTEKRGSISRAAFENQMSWLSNGGYTAITPSQLIDFMEFRGQLPQRAILITVDTESASFIEQALPILKTFGMTATLCVATAPIGKPGNLTWDQLRQIKQAGVCVGSRGREGRSLTRRPKGQSLEAHFRAMEAGLREAKQTIERQLGAGCSVLAYPQGHSSDLVAATAAKLGFSLAFVQSAGENPFFGNRLAMHRLMIDRHLGPGEFTQMLTTLVALDLP